MNFKKHHFKIAAHWVVAIEYDDVDHLSPEEERVLDRFLKSLPGVGHWSWGDDIEICRDEIGGKLAECVRGTYLERNP